jgi:hypothetical protein
MLYALKDAETGLYYSRSNKWVKQPKVWRIGKEMKGVLNLVAEPFMYEANNGSRWRTSGDLPARSSVTDKEYMEAKIKNKLSYLPDTYHIYAYRDIVPPQYIGLAKEVYFQLV